MDARYYDWDATISYDADVTMVVGARGIGKTFGLRLRYAEIVRTKTQLSVVSDGYFSRLSRMPDCGSIIIEMLRESW